MNSTTSASSPPDGILLFAHGSRDPLWKRPMAAVATRITQTHPHTAVACAYLELCEPSLPQAAAHMITQLSLNATNKVANYTDNMPASAQKSLNIRILPMFLGMGKHAREDLPEIAAQLRSAHPQVHFEIAPAIGEDERVTQLLAELAVATPIICNSLAA
jgi:sirohydrochlorin cobaltochelatase